LSIAESRVAALFRHDARRRLVEVNQWDGGVAPRFFLMRTPEGVVARFRQDVPDDLATRLSELCAGERLCDPPPERPAHEREYLDALGPVERVWAGPAFTFPDDLPAAAAAVAIDEANAGLLRNGFEDWLPDVPHRRPFVAVIEEGRAVAICASVRISRDVHCAGVETLPGCRGRGHGSAAVAAWARAVRELGATPFYSTSWDNLASRGLARRLGLRLFAVDFHII
jgi:GNAT superfamily N-acetyltransferase